MRRGRGGGLAIASMVMVAACRPPSSSAPTSGATEVEREAAPPRAASPPPASPALDAKTDGAVGTPQETPATLRVDHLVGHPARWDGHEVFIVGRLVYQVGRCTKSEPPSCTGDWFAVDAESTRPQRVVLVTDGIAVPIVCRPAASALVARSPCTPDEPDPDARYRIAGALRHDNGVPSFVVSGIEPLRD